MKIHVMPVFNRPIPTAIEGFQRNFDEVVNNLFQESGWPTNQYHEGNDRSFPQVNMDETGEEFRVDVDLPGMKASEIDLTLQENRLTIHGERKFKINDDGRTHRLKERPSGQFVRTINLHQKVDPKKASARYDNGVLKIVISKAEEAINQSSKIEVKSGNQENLGDQN